MANIMPVELQREFGWTSDEEFRALAEARLLPPEEALAALRVFRSDLGAESRKILWGMLTLAELGIGHQFVGMTRLYHMDGSGHSITMNMTGQPHPDARECARGWCIDISQHYGVHDYIIWPPGGEEPAPKPKNASSPGSALAALREIKSERDRAAALPDDRVLAEVCASTVREDKAMRLLTGTVVRLPDNLPSKVRR